MGDKKTDLIAKAICVVEEATASFKKKRKKKKIRGYGRMSG